MSMNTATYDYLIIGQGLAGSLIAWQLKQAQKHILVIDPSHSGSASRIAAGIINPITGHRLNLTDGFERYWAAAKPFYEELESHFELSLLYPLEQTRLIKNQGQFGYLQKRLEQADYAGYLHRNKTPEAKLKDADFGSVNVLQSWRVDLSLLLDAIKQDLLKQNLYCAGKVLYQKSELTQDKITAHVQTDDGVKQISAKSIIFCEGYQAINNPWLSALPFKLAKGDTAELVPKDPSSQNQAQNQLLNWGQWLLSKERSLTLGSTYLWNDASLEKSDKNLGKLLSGMLKHSNFSADDFEIQHKVGIRPSTINRQPFVGSISKLKQLSINAYCFNGLGSKGSLIAPYFAKLLTQHILYNKPMPEEVSKWL
jgi:glycine/D-amino acid oxidase-like deaminating enzyme